MKKLFTKLFGFFERKNYHPDQAAMPVFDETATSDVAHSSAEIAQVKEFDLAEELKKAKAEIAEVDKAFKELSNYQS